MISDVIYPRAKFVPVGRHSSSAARLPLSVQSAEDPRDCSGPEVEDPETLSRRLFLLRADTLRIDDSRACESHGYSRSSARRRAKNQANATISYLGSFSRFPVSFFTRASFRDTRRSTLGNHSFALCSAKSNVSLSILFCRMYESVNVFKEFKYC